MKWVAIAIFAVLALSLPFVAGDFYVNLASQIFIAAIFASGFAIFHTEAEQRTI